MAGAGGMARVECRMEGAVMVWFRQRRKPGRSGVPLASDEPLERWERRVADAGLRFVEIKQTGKATYQTLAGEDPEKAKAFLRNEPVDKEKYYIIVETPDGNWGTDFKGLFLEHLRPWQTDTANADCRGLINSLIDANQSIEAAAQGWADNFVVEVNCGRCDHKWVDAIRYRDDTLVRCSACRARNLIDSRGFTFTRVTYGP
jgi:hypothetical protein